MVDWFADEELDDKVIYVLVPAVIDFEGKATPSILTLDVLF